MITKIAEEQIPALARLHKENLPSFLSAFPVAFIEKFYALQLQRKKQILFGAFQGEQLVGFVFGTDNVERLFEDFIKDNRLYFYSQTFIALISSPKYLVIQIIQTLSKNYKSPCKRQLVYIATDRQSEIKGMGSALLKALEVEWQAYHYYELEVDAENDAFEFYKKKGFFVVHEYDFWLERKLLLGKTLK